MLKKIMKKKKETPEPKQNKKMHWDPQIAMITSVAIILIIALSAFSGYVAVNALKNANVAPPVITPPSDVKACALQSTLAIPLSKGMMCGTDSASCAPSGAAKIKMLAFHSPSCPYCDAQVPVLEKLKQEFGSAIDVQYVCKSIHAGDDVLCQENKDGLYLDWATSQKLVKDFALETEGTPILVVNCDYKRVGSYALKDQSTNATSEYDDLKKIINGLSA